MIGEADRYVLLMSSLPRLPARFFSVRRLPISRAGLDFRLQWLKPSDAACLERIESIVSWVGGKGQSEQIFIDRCQEIRALTTQESLRQLIDWQLELRFLLWALRLRHAGAEPEDFRVWRFCRWANDVKAHWQVDDFGLKRRLPWLAAVRNLLQDGEYFELEKFLLDLVWQYYAGLAAHHHFDLVAVVVYAMRWQLLQRWLSYDGDRAGERLQQLSANVLTEYALINAP